MIVTVNVPDSTIIKDGVSRACKLPDGLDGVWAIHIDTDSLSYVDRKLGFGDNTIIENAEAYAAPFIAAFEAAAQPVVQPEVDVNSVHMAYLKLALSDLGFYGAVDNAINEAGEATRILWNSATLIRETDPEVGQIAAVCGLDVQAIFARAREIAATRKNS